MNDPIIGNVIEGCLREDRKSQEAVYRMFHGKMLGVCLRYTKDMEKAQDVLQDGFIKVFTNIGKFNRQGSFEGWVRRIMVNTAIDSFRKNRSDWILLGEDESIENYMDVEDEEEEGAEYSFETEDVVRAMQQLSPAYKVVFNLYVFENLQHQEIARKLNISVGTSKSNLAKAKKNLKKILLKEIRKADG